MNTVNTRFHKTVVYSICRHHDDRSWRPLSLLDLLSMGGDDPADGFTLDWYINLLTGILASYKPLVVHCLSAWRRCHWVWCWFCLRFSWCFTIFRNSTRWWIYWSYYHSLCRLWFLRWVLLQLYADKRGISLIGTPWILIGTYFTIALPFMYRAIASSFEAINYATWWTQHIYSVQARPRRFYWLFCQILRKA